MKKLYGLCFAAIPLVLGTGCARTIHADPSPSYPYVEKTTVEFQGVKIPARPGSYHQNPANKWCSIGNVASKLRVTGHNPKFIVRYSEAFDLEIVRLSVGEDASRYFYFWPQPTDLQWKTIAPGVAEVTATLPCGEYAFWRPRGNEVPKDEDSLWQYQGGTFWDFGIED